MHELPYHDDAIFITLTYNEFHMPSNVGLRPAHLQLFIKRLRNEVAAGMRYYAVGEYGDNFGRPHYHGIFFGIGMKDLDVIREAWGLGFVYGGSVTDKSINYVTKYINKKMFGKVAKDEYGDRIAPFARMSKGLGISWLKENGDQVLQHMGVRRRGKTVRAPRYYFKKLDAIEDSMANELVLERAEKRRLAREAVGVTGVEVTERVIASREMAEADLKAKESMRKRSGLEYL